MSKKTTSLLTGAIISGLLAGATALANNHEKADKHTDPHASAGKDGCNGKTDKDSCKGHAKTKKAKKDKNSCHGKDGCGEKKEKAPEHHE